MADAQNSRWTADRMPSQAGRIAVVTGANSGLGLQTSIALAAAGARVVMACRNPAKAEQALAEVQRRAPQGEAELLSLDLASLASVRRFAGAFRERHARLDLLINNAGILGVPLGHTVDGFESQMGTNHLGHFALTGLLIDPLLATPGSRIVTIASLGHWRSRGVNAGDFAYARTPYSEFTGYANSKLANLLFVLELSRRLAARGSHVIAAAAHPGGADTDIQKVDPKSLQGRIQNAIKPFLLRSLINTAEKGALPGLYAATAPGVAGNDYFGPDGFVGFSGWPAKASRSARARDADAARRLWEASAEATGVGFLD